MALDYELERTTPGNLWDLRLAPPPLAGPEWSCLQSVSVWCDSCKYEGGAASAFTRGSPAAMLRVRGGHRPCPSAASAAAGSVALVLSGAWIPAAGTAAAAALAHIGRSGADAEQAQQAAGAAAVARRLQQVKVVVQASLVPQG